MDNKKIDDDFFGDILNNNDEPLFEETNDEDIEFDFDSEDEEIDEIEEEIEVQVVEKQQPKKYVNKNKESYKRTQDDIEESVAELQGNINSMLKTINRTPDDMFPDPDLLPGLDIQIENHDYEKDIQLIQIDAKETLECLANLYLTEETMQTKNVYKIIKDDASLITKLNLSIECSQRMMICACKQVDMGVNDPEMFQSIAMFQKELRDTVKMVYDIQRKMKEFYKELKSELKEINAGEETIIKNSEDNLTIIGDPKMLNDMMEKMKNDPNYFKDMIK